ncbi:cytochrome P450 [Actinomadura sp. HBU206391]|uniref:cytochrome P450 n=1 Tax=Actinomadura sp. HBU206391 TaxID=2731692 RepID=UPI00164EEE2A|nr:cytochrome P450 [Actinomadura sp. HBU206391]MBC6457310.1 cytochrome P450 [Actinomadura sp. HBU206391]
MTDLPRLPFERANLLELSPAFAVLRKEEPVTRVRTSTGDEAWLVTGYEQARKIFADERFGRSHPTPETAPRLSNSSLLGGPQGEHATEKAAHDRMRRLLAPAFSARRMQALAGRVQQLVDDLLDEMEEHGPPADLHELLSVPLPIQVICELLGVPYEDRDRFRAIADDMGDLRDLRRSAAAREEMQVYTHGIVTAKRSDPGEDVYSDLAAADLPSHEVATLAGGLLFAGHETTMNQIDYGVLLLLSNPGQFEALKRDPNLTDAAVEEIMRMGASSEHGLIRYAHEDVEVDGVTIKAGELVVLATVAANRDERVYPDPERFDVTRESTDPHLGFGYAIRFCLGASLARVELRAVFGALPRRFPALRPTVPLDRLEQRPDQLTGGLMALPVTW